jgi:predicted metal-dependent hydrolase
MTSERAFDQDGFAAALKLVVSPRARVMRLRVDRRSGAVVLTMPRRASRRKALEWAAGHRDWIEKQLAQLVPVAVLADGAELPLYGEPHAIRWDEAASRVPRLEAGTLVVGGPAGNLEARILRWLRRHAAEILARETQEFAAKAGVGVSRVGIGDPLSRWGSCSSSGAIRYSWRLILAPAFVRRATVAHEVAHRVHMNHGREFHAFARELLGADHGPARAWLRRNGSGLHWVGRA